MENFKRIAISGKMGAGKTTLSNYLVDIYGYKRLFLAEPLKQLCADIAKLNKAAMGEDLSWTEYVDLFPEILIDLSSLTNSTEELKLAEGVALSMIHNFGDVTSTATKSDRVRDMLQYAGNTFRDRVRSTIWTDALLSKMATHPDTLYVIDDLRYKNEFQILRDANCVMLRLTLDVAEQKKRLKKLYGKIDPSKLQHISEVDLDDATFDYYIDGGQSLDLMLKDMDDVLKGVKLL